MRPRNDKYTFGERLAVSIKPSLLVAALASLVSASASAAMEAPDPDSVTRADWSAYMAEHPSPDEGCFRAAYPNTDWERVPCKIVHPRVHPTPVRRGASG